MKTTFRTNARIYQEGEDWCLGESNYTSLGIIGSLPSTSVMYNPLVLDTRSRASILNSLIDLNYDMYLRITPVQVLGHIPDVTIYLSTRYSRISQNIAVETRF